MAEHKSSLRAIIIIVIIFASTVPCFSTVHANEADPRILDQRIVSGEQIASSQRGASIDSATRSFLLIIFYSVVVVSAFLLLRQLVLWYWRVNHIVRRLDTLIEELKKLNAKQQP